MACRIGRANCQQPPAVSELDVPSVGGADFGERTSPWRLIDSSATGFASSHVVGGQRTLKCRHTIHPSSHRIGAGPHIWADVGGPAAKTGDDTHLHQFVGERVQASANLDRPQLTGDLCGRSVQLAGSSVRGGTPDLWPPRSEWLRERGTLTRSESCKSRPG